jgi:hypothetical protein
LTISKNGKTAKNLNLAGYEKDFLEQKKRPAGAGLFWKKVFTPF